MDKIMTRINKNPTISVIMPVYNAERFLKQAVESILNQTFDDFEFLIIDDNSSDNTREIIRSYKDNRIKLITNPVRVGFTNSLNQGLKIAQGEYIARMDSDDISEPDRFLKQINFLKNNPDIGVCGSWIKVIDENNNILQKSKLPLTHKLIVWNLFFNDCIAHPSVIFRRHIMGIPILYNPQFETAEDYELWIRMSKITKIENIPEYLLKYRIHGKNISANRNKILNYDYIIREKAIEYLFNHQLNDHEIHAIKEWVFQFPSKSAKDILIIRKIIARMYKIYITSNNFTNNELKEINFFTANQYFTLASQSKNISLRLFFICIIEGIKYSPKSVIYPFFRRMLTFRRKNKFFAIFSG